ncbi:FDXHR family putative zinc-binding protein [Kitasatospora saccharophila]|uniref:FDXHR family putative zinc-binding protein n=1 Tax=Kitasatospora saccharophila TaxID=407973 RepID=UPI003CD06754
MGPPLQLQARKSPSWTDREAALRTVHPECGRSWSGRRAEHCPACCETFAGTRAGDAHRTGPYGARRCLPPATAGLWQDDQGIWHRKPYRDR